MSYKTLRKYMMEICKLFKRSSFIIVVMIALISGCKSFDHLTRIDMVYPKAELCKECHIDIYNEWIKSPHAKAFSSSTYRQATNNYQFANCLGCHVPQPTVSDEPLKSRNIFREEGVTCSSCHLEESKMVGPIEPTGKVAPHPMGVSRDRYRNSKFCGRCHEGTFKEWKQVKSAKKRNCQDCHMPSIKRKITQSNSLISKVIVAMEKEVLQKQHTFAIHTKLPDIEPFGIDFIIEGKQFKLILKNNLPHGLPTGDFGFRVLVVDVSAVQTNGMIVPVRKIELIKEINTAVPPKSSDSWKFSLLDNVKAIRCVITRHSRDSANVEILYREEVSIP